MVTAQMQERRSSSARPTLELTTKADQSQITRILQAVEVAKHSAPGCFAGMKIPHEVSRQLQWTQRYTRNATAAAVGEVPDVASINKSETSIHNKNFFWVDFKPQIPLRENCLPTEISRMPPKMPQRRRFRVLHPPYQGPTQLRELTEQKPSSRAISGVKPFRYRGPLSPKKPEGNFQLGQVW